jgi:glycosyltransferase involved in cell wall biosynthesis
VRAERVGLSAARNIGVQFSKGDFVIFLDADDYLYPGAVEINMYFFSLHKNIAFVSGIFDKIDEKGYYINPIIAESKSNFIYLSLLQGNYIAMEATVMYRRKLFFYFHFDTHLKCCEDYDLNLRISRQLPALHHENKLAVYRMHQSNMSKNINQMLTTALFVLKKQKEFLLNDEEKAAYEQGIQNWINYYS